MISSPFESAYAISSAVSKMVTLGDLYDLKGHCATFAYIYAAAIL